MTLAEAKIRYPEIAELYTIIKQHQIKMTVLPASKDFTKAYFQNIEFSSKAFHFNIPVDDEYGDASLGNPALLLQLIIYMIEEYEDRDDFLVWCTAYNLNASNPVHLEWYRQLGAVTPKIREIIEPGFSGISDYDWQLNAGAAQALRELEK